MPYNRRSTKAIPKSRRNMKGLSAKELTKAGGTIGRTTAAIGRTTAAIGRTTIGRTTAAIERKAERIGENGRLCVRSW